MLTFFSHAFLTAIGTGYDPQASSFFLAQRGPKMSAVWTLALDNSLTATYQGERTPSQV